MEGLKISKMNKKANLFTDLIVWMIVVFIFAVTMIIIYYVVNITADTIMDDVVPTMNSPGVNVTDIANKTVGMLKPGYEPLKWITYALIIGSMISVLMGNFLVRVHPVYVIPYIFVMAIAVIISVPLSNAYEDLLYNDAMLGATFQGFYGVSWIFLHLPIWVLLIGVLGGITMFVGLLRDNKQIIGGF